MINSPIKSNTTKLAKWVANMVPMGAVAPLRTSTHHSLSLALTGEKGAGCLSSPQKVLYRWRTKLEGSHLHLLLFCCMCFSKLRPALKLKAGEREDSGSLWGGARGESGQERENVIGESGRKRRGSVHVQRSSKTDPLETA